MSVVVPTHDRPALVERLLLQLGRQTVAHDDIEVIVVDDGSATSVRERLEAVSPPFALRVIEQDNAGAASARDRGARLARGEVLVFVDDDMQVDPGFLDAHRRRHEPNDHTVVFGHIRPDPTLGAMPLFERYHAAMLDRWVADVKAGRAAISGLSLCTGNVSLRRRDYLDVGGFDVALARSEDAELGLRLAKHGCTLTFAEDAYTFHGSDHTRLGVWLERAFLYGVYDAKIARKHPDALEADPWRYLFLVHPVSRPLLLGSALAPTLFRGVSRLALGVSLALDQVGAEDTAIAGTTLVYGLEYFRGLRSELGGTGRALRDLGRYLRARPSG